MKFEAGGPDLIALEDYDEIPDGTELVNIFGEHAIKGKDPIDLDTRFGYIAWSN